jgi:hypothetical protein
VNSRFLGRASRLVTVSALLASIVVSVASTSASASTLTSSADWHVIATMGNSMTGLAGDANGNLLTFDMTNTLSEFPAASLGAAVLGAPVAPAAVQTLVHFNPGPAGDWIAGIVPLANGTTLFDNGLVNAVYLESAPGVYSDVATAATWLNRPEGLALDATGALYVVNSGFNGTLYRVPPLGGGFDWAHAVQVMGGIGPANQVQVDSHGDVFVASESASAIYELPASTLAAILGGASFATPSSGLVTVASGTQISGVNGLAFDTQGNLYFSVYDASGTLSNGGQLTVGEVPASWLSTPQTATVNNGGILVVADTVDTPYVDRGLQPLAVVNGVLYAGSFDSNQIYAYRLGTHATPVTNLSVRVVGGNLVATWSGNATTSYTCTLLYGFGAPSSFTVTSRLNSCVFYNVGNTALGVRVMASGANGTSTAVSAFASMTTIKCVRGRTIRYVTAYSPRCPAGFIQR